jgi:2-methylcitrate dehydratase PrpD
MAIGIAASQPVGLREQFGTMSKSLHPGAAARIGLMAALMARHGYTASARALEAPRGLLQVVSTACRWDEATDELGRRFEISFNSYKPYACGIVIHPAIEACARLREQGVTPDQVERIALKVHPLVLELTGKKEPADGLQAKFSVYHGCAAGLVFGRAGEAEFSDAIATRADIVALRRKVVASVDAQVAEDAVSLSATLTDGRVITIEIDHAVGSSQRPLTDAMLDAKFHGLVDPVLGAARGNALIAACRGLATATELRAFVALCQP